MHATVNISDDNIAMDYIRRLKDYREKHGLSQRQLSKVIRCVHSTIYAYEKNKSIPSVNTYNTLADFFNWPRYSPQHSHIPAQAHEIQQDDSLTLPLDFDGDNDNAPPADDKKHRAYSIPEALLDDIRDIATIKGCSMSEIITSVLEEYTAKHKGSLLAIRAIRNS